MRTYVGDILKPTYTHPSQQVFNYAWILGPEENVPDPVMRKYARLLEVLGLRTIGESGVQVVRASSPPAAD